MGVATCLVARASERGRESGGVPSQRAKLTQMGVVRRSSDNLPTQLYLFSTVPENHHLYVPQLSILKLMKH